MPKFVLKALACRRLRVDPSKAPPSPKQKAQELSHHMTLFRGAESMVMNSMVTFGAKFG